METPTQPQSRTALTLPATVKYQIVWQETPTGRRPEQACEGNIVISVTDITTIGSGSGSQQRQYMAIAKLTWGSWEANFGCSYYPLPCMFLEFKCLRMNDAMRSEVQGMDVDGGEERKEEWEKAEPKIRSAAADDHDHRMLRVEVEGPVGQKDRSCPEQRQGVKLWAKRVIGNEEVQLSVAEKSRLQID